jgi:hypothetical protein
VRRVLRAARRRYHRLPATERPGPQPENLCGVFTADEVLTLMDAGRWPLSARDVEFVTEKPRRPYLVLAVRVAVEVG